MSIVARRTGQMRQPTFAELYVPKLVTVLREGYGVADFRADVMSGLTVAIVALPLSMAIAIASGVTPDRGLYTAVIGGFIVSLLGGSRFQIGGPAGALTWIECNKPCKRQCIVYSPPGSRVGVRR